ncbi:unnamed protein product, partial [Soboliphyme baturini]|uniref:C2H2-type domain-containing protein n=1 Tax=Soboliphyme baturini TaxID=241478 RepID=A0A183J1K1_9BILA
PYHCQYCTYQSYIRGKVTRHIQQVHNGFPVRIVHRPVPGIKDRITDMKLRCFPFLSGLMDGAMVIGGVGSPADPSAQAAAKYGAGSGDLGQVSCMLCEQRVAATDASMNDHVQVHISSKFYHCPVCTYATTFLIRAKQHVHSAHPQSQETRILCCPPDGVQGLQALRQKCFGGVADECQEMAMDCSVARTPDKAKTVDCGGETTPRSDSNLSATLNNDCEHEDTMADTGDALDMDESDGGDSKLVCAVCKEAVPRQLSTITLHARQHVVKLFQCAYCGWNSEETAEVKVHCVSSHSGLPIKANIQNSSSFTADNLLRPALNSVSVINGSDWAQTNSVQRCFPDFSIISNFPGSGGSSPSSSSSTPAVGFQGSASSGTVLRKLICRVCTCNIADNPKSIGIHVKNHLNYKPYRCPYCHYMSCEQSKARRHVEHVHSVSGDSVEIRAEENIKEKIARMKSKCFPNATSLALSDSCCSIDESVLGDIPSIGKASVVCQESSEGFKVYECQICKERISSECIGSHVRTHLGKPYCTSRFWTEDKVKYHTETVHPESVMKTDMQDEDLDAQFRLVQKKCFPTYEDSENEKDTDDSEHGTSWGDDKLSPEEVSSLGTELAGDSPRALSKVASDSEISAYLQKSSSSADGRLTCQLCKQSISMNPNSLDVHVKNHLNFKPHQCPCCDYKSCTSGKVKRHLDSVHRGVDTNIISFTQSSSTVKQIIGQMRSMCFPQIEGDFQTKTKAHLNSQVILRRLFKVMHVCLTSVCFRSHFRT